MSFQICPAFIRWQVVCTKCDKTFYVDAEPETTKEDIAIILDDIDCEEHPMEQHSLELA